MGDDNMAREEITRFMRNNILTPWLDNWHVSRTSHIDCGYKKDGIIKVRSEATELVFLTSMNKMLLLIQV